MIEKRLRNLWDQLQGKKPHLQQFLSEIHLDGIRGFDSLRVMFDYPVSVIAGGNATGKSTVLFAAACAYKVPEAGARDFFPSTLLPDYRPKLGEHQDARRKITMQFHYLTPDGRLSMQWQRSKGWGRSFFGRKNVSQPERQVYLRTLSNLSNPSEVRSVLRMSRLKSEPRIRRFTASQIEFVHHMLPFRYSEVVNLSEDSRTKSNKTLLFAAREGGAAYSELHMAAGERALLRLSGEITQLDSALVLIDEVEAGLHPWVQQLLMLHLQQLALRNNLQIIVTSHSPVVLDAVPPHARIFLDRDEPSGKVVVRPPYRDVVQNALYGRATEALKVLCEDESAECILKGVFDFLLPREGINWESVHIGRDTGASEFPSHAQALRKFGQIQNTVFVLDGDQRGSPIESRIHRSAGDAVFVLFLPGDGAPETWVWEKLRDSSDVDSVHLGTTQVNLSSLMNQVDAVYDTASDSPQEIAKSKFSSLCEHLNREAPEVCRVVARLEAERKESDIQPLVESLQDILLAWRK